MISEEFDNTDRRFIKRILYWVLGLGLLVSGISFLCNRSVQVVDNGILHYEEFQEIYNSCSKINTDLCNMKNIPESDKMFEQFSKAQRLNTLRTNLNRWVEEYNGKSKMFNRSIWKSNSLPYQLNCKDFSCY